MVPKFTILSVLIISTTCSILPLIPIQIHFVPIQPIQHDRQPQEAPHIPNYSFSYSVNDDHTGDIKHQQETRHGGTVTGQYSLIQPDGITRTVDYRADDARGFLATVNNNRGNLNRQFDDDRQEDQYQQWQAQSQHRQPQSQHRESQLQQRQPEPQQWQQSQPQQRTPQRERESQQWQPQPQQQTQSQNLQNVTPPSMAISRSSVVQNFQKEPNSQAEGHSWA